MIKKSKGKTMLSTGIIIGLIIVGLSIMTFSYFDIGSKWADMYQNGILTKAVVTQVQGEVSNKNFKSECCFYTYKVNNQDYNFKLCNCDFKIGDSLTIKYNPKQIAEHEVMK